jgi:hypothetical protein
MNAGFYKTQDGEVYYGPNFVVSATYELYKEFKDSYEYPIDGWYWFEDEDEAYLFFNIEKPIELPSMVE